MIYHFTYDTRYISGVHTAVGLLTIHGWRQDGAVGAVDPAHALGLALASLDLARGSLGSTSGAYGVLTVRL